MESLTSGTLAGTGSFRCEECGYVVTLAAADELPTCPGCGSSSFARASLFSAVGASRFSRATKPEKTPQEREAWLAEARQQVTEPGQYLVFERDKRTEAIALEREWTRVGRSLAADVRFDDPTVSRRHALIVRQPDGVRVLDDRSLNGVFVNGERVEWRELHDGDEIVVGRYRLTFLDVAPTAAEAADGTLEAAG
ncbi:MAG TPA: FHA domain-containing protein [Solirubrobacteraceae bacterium]|nr:FHA domain-containing protein [Solirubrobacteraceae bacterium]